MEQKMLASMKMLKDRIDREDAKGIPAQGTFMDWINRRKQ